MITTPILKKLLAIILITVGLLLLFGNQGKYKRCIKACDDNPECLKEIGRHPGDPIRCVKWSTEDCINICVEKYK